MSARRTLRALCALAFAAVAGAQEQGTTLLQVSVTGVSGRDVYLDRGSASGVATGQLVRLFPPGTGGVDVEVRSVSSNSARAELPPGSVAPPIGTRGEVAVPKAAPAPAPPPTRDTRPAPAHPPWTRTLDARNPDDPLLVPTFGQKPDERPMTLDGRLFGSSQWNRDSGGGRDDEYLLSRLGVRAEAMNALGFGERTRFSGEFDDRRTKVPDRPDRDELTGRVDELSVAFGIEHWAPIGAQVGRFLSPHLPELGLVDGAEVVFRYENGLRFGGGLGAYPRPFPGRASGEDTGLHAFGEYVADERRTFAATVGLQKTWHQGAPDRDLLLLRVDGRPRDDLWLHANAKVDWYTGGDDRKSAGPEITEFLGQAQWSGQRVGVGATVSHFRWPDLQRVEYQNLPDDLVRDGSVDRLSLSGWARPAQDLRVSARADSWQDQDDAGTAVELGFDWSDVLHSDTDVSVQWFRTEGGAQSGPGLRIVARRPFGDAHVHAGYRWYDYRIEGLIAGEEAYTRQALDLGVSWSVGDVDLDLQAEHWFGSQEDAWALGFYVQWRF
ncbi:MAG: hypothetical protein AB7O97_02445 [Planctomycetota bacterium]